MTGGRWDAVVMGCSAGGLEVLRTILPRLPAGFRLPVVVVAHTSDESGGLLAELLDACCALPARVAEDKTPVSGGTIHVAPPGYHLLIEHGLTFALSLDAKVCNVRPAIDVLFASAAEVFQERLVGVLLTGANEDGCAGLAAIKALGGLTIAQDPDTAAAQTMPRSAIAAGVVDHVLSPAAIAGFLVEPDRPGRSR